MVVEETKLKGCFVITSRVFEDSRGEFFETYNRKNFEELTGVKTNFVQDNQSTSKKGVLRGIHFQEGEHSQAKLVRVTTGVVLDICVDFREDSDTFGEHMAIVLSADNHKQIYIPKGFGHGFLVLSDYAVFNYKCDNYYNKSSERGIIFNDSTLGIDWGINEKDLILSDKDKGLPTFISYFDEKKS